MDLTIINKQVFQYAKNKKGNFKWNCEFLLCGYFVKVDITSPKVVTKLS